VGAYMIAFSSIVSFKDLILKPVHQPFKTCSICLKTTDSLAVLSCAGCLYPYDNQHSFLHFDYFEYLQYSAVNSIKAHNFFMQNSALNPCVFCGSDAVLQDKLISLYERYYPADNNASAKYKDTLRAEAFFIGCTGCTFATEYLFLYQFYGFYDYLTEAWNSGKSRLNLIRYSDLRLPDWAINYQLLKTLKKYAADYQERFSPQLSLFSDVPKPASLSKRQAAAIALQNMCELYAAY
jgi:hypothetical protein